MIFWNGFIILFQIRSLYPKGSLTNDHWWRTDFEWLNQWWPIYWYIYMRASHASVDNTQNEVCSWSSTSTGWPLFRLNIAKSLQLEKIIYDNLCFACYKNCCGMCFGKPQSISKSVLIFHQTWFYSDSIATHNIIITMTSQWAPLRPKSPASRLFIQTFIQAQIKENTKGPCHRWPVNSPPKGLVIRKMFLFVDVIVNSVYYRDTETLCVCLMHTAFVCRTPLAICIKDHRPCTCQVSEALCNPIPKRCSPPTNQYSNGPPQPPPHPSLSSR